MGGFAMTNLQEELLISLANKGVDSLATKADLAEVEGRVMAQLVKSETRVTWRMVGATGVMIAAVGLMIRFLG